MGFQLASVYEPARPEATPSMVASSRTAVSSWTRIVVEEKFDGVRCQAHIEPASEDSWGAWRSSRGASTT